MSSQLIKVWDPLVRIFHWSLVTLFLIAFATEDDFMDLHAAAGYLMVGLIVIRLLWGIIGTRHARFSSFVKSPSEVIDYLKDVALFRAKRYIGHNPAGGAMVIALIISLSMALFTGMVTYGATEFAGPFASWFSHVGEGTADALEEVHEFFANFTLLLVFLHVGGVLIASLQHRENLIRSMINGYKEKETSETDAQSNHGKEVM